MGIYGALSTAVSGLRAQSFALENISGNIANSRTIGYKRVETDFVDLVAEAAKGRQTAGSVLAASKSTNSIQGDVTTASSGTNMALNGDGYFVVEQKTGTNDGVAKFGGTSYYTRRGDFMMDKDGYLVNGSGFYLKGLPIDPATGNVSGSVPTVIQISNAVLPAQATTRINYELNLPAVPQTADYDPAVANSELLQAADYTPAYTAGSNISAADSQTFLKQSIAGGAITVYATNGAPVDVQLRWAKTDSYNAGGTDTWELFYMSDSKATGAATQWTNVGQSYSFAADGSMSPDVPTVNLTGLSVDGVTVGNVVLKHGSGGVTQFADANGTSAVTSLSQNGYSAGDFVSTAINESGRVVATYSNGEQIEVAQIVIAQFNSPDNLQKKDGGIFAQTTESGEPIVDYSGGGIVGSAVESSNTDISEEFTKLIVTQQAYSASTRIVSTTDQMLKEALNMIR